MTTTVPNVLVVDDEATIRDTVADALELEGYAVTRAANGAEALEFVRQQRPSAIVLDMMMPVMNGWEFLKHCRIEPLCKCAPVVVISAIRNLPTDPATLGVKDCIAKPFDLGLLLGAVERWVRPTA